jgi:hypothetical protein
MFFAISDLIVAVLDAIVFFVSYINQAAIAYPVIRVDNAFGRYSAADYRLSHGFGAIRNYFCVNFTTSLENSKDRSLS